MQYKQFNMTQNILKVYCVNTSSESLSHLELMLTLLVLDTGSVSNPANKRSHVLLFFLCAGLFTCYECLHVNGSPCLCPVTSEAAFSDVDRVEVCFPVNLWQLHTTSLVAMVTYIIEITHILIHSTRIQCYYCYLLIIIRSLSLSNL